MTSPADQQARQKAHEVAMNTVRSGGSDAFPDPAFAVDKITEALLTFSSERCAENKCVSCGGPQVPELVDEKWRLLEKLEAEQKRCKELEERLEYFQKEFPQKYAHNYAEKERRIKDLEQKLAEAEQANKNMKGLEPVIRFIESQENLPHKYVEIINKHFWELF